MIVLAEENEARRHRLLELLGEMGHSVTAATTARDLIRHIKSISIKMMLVNPRLPDIDDKIFGLLRKVRTRYSKQELPIVLIMEPGAQETMLKGFSSGINGIVRLPLDLDLVRAQLQSHIELKKEYDALVLQFHRGQALRQAETASEMAEPATTKPLQQTASDPEAVGDGDPTEEIETNRLQAALRQRVAQSQRKPSKTAPSQPKPVVAPKPPVTTAAEKKAPAAKPVKKDQQKETPAAKKTEQQAPAQTKKQAPSQPPPNAPAQEPASFDLQAGNEDQTLNLGFEDRTVTTTGALQKEHIFPGAGGDRHLPCEIPVTLTGPSQTVFGKTIWLSRHQLLLMVFEELNADTLFKIRMRDTQGSNIELECRENRRERVAGQSAGTLKVNLQILKASNNYEHLFFLLEKTYKSQGLSGLKTLLPKSEETPAEHYARNLGSTLIFSSSEAMPQVHKGIRYTFERRLARGSFSDTYLIRDMVLQRPVVMKVLNKNLSEKHFVRLSFLSEAQVAAQFHHPNIVFVYEVGELFRNHYERHLSFPAEIIADHGEEWVYLTMEWVAGSSLQEWFQHNPKPPREKVLDMLIQVLEALAFAHERNIAHRNLHPANILIAEKRVRVADFGLVPLASDGADGFQQMVDTTFGSPEQLEGENGDRCSDIYSFGVIAYRLLAGMLPFVDNTTGEIPSVAAIDDRLHGFLHKCLLIKPKERFRHAGAALKELREIMGNRVESSHLPLIMQLTELIDTAAAAKGEKDALRALKNLTAFTHKHKTLDDVALLKAINKRLTDPVLIGTLLDRNLNYDNLKALHRYFTELGSSGVVTTLLNRFQKETSARVKQWAGELAILCVGRDVLPLVDFGLELPDQDACILLKAFHKAAPASQETIYLRWSLHPGFQTQMELLKIAKNLKDRNTEVLNILNLYANGNGTTHNKVRNTANKLLEDRMSLI